MKSTQNRREFLKSGLAGLAGAAALAKADLRVDGKKSTDEDPSSRKSNAAKPVLRALGDTGIRLPIVSMGACVTQDPGLLRGAMDAGIVLFTTSEYYGNGRHERMLGRLIKGRRRDSVLVLTSANPDGYDFKAGLFTEASKPGPFIAKLEGSLKRLDMETVDFFLLPFAARRESVFFEPLLNAMERIKKQGKARFIGIATHQFEPEAIRAAVETGIYDVVMTAYNFRKDNRVEIEEALEFAAGAGLGTIAMKTMAGAYWDKEKTRPINAGAALKWVLRNGRVHTAVPGVADFQQLDTDLSVMHDPVLSDQEQADLKLTFTPGSDGPFCQQCARCIPQCPHGLDIPSAMRAHMYAYGYGNADQARETLSLAGVSPSACGRCGACSVRCAMRSDIRRKMLDVAELAASYGGSHRSGFTITTHAGRGTVRRDRT